MKITLHADLKKAESQVITMEEFHSDLSSVNMYFRYPECIDIKADFNSVEFQDKIKKTQHSFERIEADVIKALEMISLEYQGHNLEIYCYIVSLGTYGYFNEPNEIYVNAWDAGIEFILETIVHEALHLILANYTKKMSYEETEQCIDSMFSRPVLRNLFPNYKVQSF
jgi:hypothetical protein